MAEAIVMPKLGLTMQTGTVTQWSVSEGQRVTAGSAVAEITTEKITYVLEAPADGVLLKVVVPVDGEAPIGATIGIFGQPGEDIASLLAGARGRQADAAAPGPAAAASPGLEPATAAPAATASPAPGPPVAVEDGAPISPAGPIVRVPASPAAKKRAAELGVDLARVSGTGPGGRVTLDDVDLAVEAQAASPPGTGAPTAVSEAPASGVSSRLANSSVTPIRAEPPLTTHHVRADAYALVELVATFNAHRHGRDDISVTAAMVKAVAATLRERPRLAPWVGGEVIAEGDAIDIGVALAAPDGVTVVVVRDAAGKTLGEVSREIAAPESRARGHVLAPEEVFGAVFTVADVSGHGSVDWSTGLIHRGEAPILTVGCIVDDVVATDGSPTVRSTAALSLTFDHRAIDPASAADFLAVLLDYLVHPARMLV
ncbi:MAG: 2-oxo acid dehydrogenase subunit E2 [Thermoleophilia bacterium]|nr:2-oxo acid dehydrogenase subunit E2 [Thermoleophilia bacterium]